ncbi:putative competence-damage inducible protein [Nitrospira sp. KM1]|uniref:competence/damage-inducible protein A n=1 Tax=Nitrospira sp. KM1 TaxID=1936990 RepID=UPI0013A71D87|nr:competence/damage-inducible protein A [Nitrospira sp. KM1]BCA53142.1 putative competence-damage inducible protein [Nitrospira sp. KM1]
MAQRRHGPQSSIVAETIAVGSELIVGGRSDSNSCFIVDQLGLLGIEARYKTIVGDDESDIATELRSAAKRACIIVVTGGLGPTVDDLTREAVARATGRKLARRKEALDAVKSRLALWGRVPNAGQRRQGLVPTGATVIGNPVGSAPGFWMVWHRVILFVLPGVPREMEAMMKEGVVPVLQAYLQQRRRVSQPLSRQVFHIYGLAESEVDERLSGIVPHGAAIDLGLLAAPSGVLVSLTTNGKKNLSSSELNGYADELRLRLKDWIFAEGDHTMEEVVGRALTELDLTVAVAESCTGGLIGHRLTQVPGSSSYFERGVICYSNRAKVELLGVPADTIEQFGAVSSEVAAAMAQGICERSRASLGLSVTGIAGPGGATPNKPVGLVYIGLYEQNGNSVTKEYRFHGDRSVIKQRASQAALDMLRRWCKDRTVA